MALSDELQEQVDAIIAQAWAVRDGRVVPASADIALAGGAVKLNATLLYADLADSTTIAMWDKRVAARLFKAFLACCSRIIRHHDGSIRSFDGDRVMGVFVGDSKNTAAAKCALKINWAFLNAIKPSFEARYKAFSNGTHLLRHCVGVDTSEMLVVRGGIRNNNDLVWVGRAPNVAAKLSALRDSPYNSFITKDVYSVMNEKAKTSGGRSMWEARIWTNGPVKNVYRSSWTWKP